MHTTSDLEAAISPHLRILTVDDQPGSLEQIGTVLRRLGLKYRAYLDPAAALADALAEPPDVLITQLAMPGMDGRELMRRLRERSPTTRLIAVTDAPAAGAGVQQDQQTEPTAADFLLGKPLHPLALLAALYTATASPGHSHLPGWAG